MRTFILAVTGLAFSVAACNSYDTSAFLEVKKAPPRVASVSVTVPLSLTAGQTARGVAMPKDASGVPLAGRPITWFTSSASIASVTDSGIISAVAPGSAVVSAVSEGISGQATMAVMPPTPTPIATIAVAVSPSTVAIGQTAHATATLLDLDGKPIVGRAITWLSSSSSVAAIAPTGDVTALAPGTAMISASSEGKSAFSALSVTAPPPAPIPVASVSVSPASATVQAGSTLQLTAVMRDANANVLTGRVVTWSSANTGVASVNSTSGLATAVATGTTQITATSETQSGSASVNVQAPPPPPLPGSYNEPSGMRPISERGFNALNELGWHDTDVGAFTIFADPTAPHSPSNVGRMTFPPGFPAGSSPGLAFIPTGSPKTIYIRFYAKLSSNWVGNGAGYSKFFYEWSSSPNNEGFFLAARGAGGGSSVPLEPWAMLQGVISSPGCVSSFCNLAPNLVPSARIIRGQWHLYEFLLTGNSAGTADGAVDWYLDGVHIGSVGRLQWTTSATAFTEFDWRPVWGGIDANPPITATQTMDWDHVYISGKN